MKSILKSKSLQIAEVRGIPILIHWTFGLFILFILFSAFNTQSNIHDAFWFVVFVIILFGFVVLHELGHAMAALKYNIKTKDIIISPIGGIARLYSIPKNPGHELVVALCGPLVNVVLAVCLFLVLIPFTSQLLPQNIKTMNLINAPIDYVRFLFIVNVSLVVFNMIPAFPMDGGRVFRALLSYKLSRKKATYIAMIVARILALAFMVFGMYNTLPMWILIGGFVLFTSGVEYGHVKTEYALNQISVQNAIIENPTILRLENTIADAQKIDRKDQKHFPIVSSNERVIGTITKPALKIFEKEENKGSSSITDLVTNSHGYMNSNLSLKSAFSIMEKNSWYTATLLNSENEKVGIVDRRSLEKCLKNQR